MSSRSCEVVDEVQMIPGIEDPDPDDLVPIGIKGLEEWLVVDSELAAEPEEGPASIGHRDRHRCRSVLELEIVFTQGHAPSSPGWSSPFPEDGRRNSCSHPIAGVPVPPWCGDRD